MGGKGPRRLPRRSARSGLPATPRGTVKPLGRQWLGPRSASRWTARGRCRRPRPGRRRRGCRAEVVPVGAVTEEDADRAAAHRAVRLGAVDDAAEGRGRVAGQECECHRHLLDIEQSQPVKPGSPLGVSVRPELINVQRTFHTEILSTRDAVATTGPPPPSTCRDQFATNSRPGRDQAATMSQPSVERLDPAPSTLPRAARHPATPPATGRGNLSEALEYRIFGVSSPIMRSMQVFLARNRAQESL